MIVGSVREDGVPVVTISVAGRDWSAIIDTGFNGDLELPEGLRSSVNAKFKGRFHSLLAGGQTVLEDTYQVDFPFDGQTAVAEATFVQGGEILIGTNLLQPYRLEIDFPAQSVRLERLRS
jgi:predicted aspartyl protease